MLWAATQGVPPAAKMSHGPCAACAAVVVANAAPSGITAIAAHAANARRRVAESRTRSQLIVPLILLPPSALRNSSGPSRLIGYGPPHAGSSTMRGRTDARGYVCLHTYASHTYAPIRIQPQARGVRQGGWRRFGNGPRRSWQARAGASRCGPRHREEDTEGRNSITRRGASVLLPRPAQATHPPPSREPPTRPTLGAGACPDRPAGRLLAQGNK